ncbi:MAG: STAS domain-containing protein [Eubacterium sp.]|nr:STAS domain-containing protein [Eubacterium sp.]
MINITKELNDSVLTVYLDGKMDTNTTPQVAEQIEADVEAADALILDMKDLKYISSAGLRLLLSLHKKMADKSGMKLKNVNETNMEILDFTGFADILDIE